MTLGYFSNDKDIAVHSYNEKPLVGFRVLLDGTIRHVDTTQKTIVVDVFDHFRQHHDYRISVARASIYASELVRGARAQPRVGDHVRVEDISAGDIVSVILGNDPGPLSAFMLYIYPGQAQRTL